MINCDSLHLYMRVTAPTAVVLRFKVCDWRWSLKMLRLTLNCYSIKLIIKHMIRLNYKLWCNVVTLKNWQCVYSRIQ